MQDLMSMLHCLHRPRLLMRAARIGAAEYRREIHLPRLLGYGNLPRQAPALMRLIEIEGILNDQRLNDDSAYNLLKHIDILIAIVGEARMLRAAQAKAA